jgi:hypothetical protein
MKKYLLILLLSSIRYCFCGPVIYSLHINGINTNLLQARQNLDALAITTKLKTNIITWDILYNKTTGLWDDLSDVFNQKAQEKQNITLDDFVVAYMKANDLHAESGTTEYEFIKQSIKDDFINDPQYSGRNLESIVTEFKQLVPDRENSYILLLPHSQGNLYANQLYNYLTSTENYDSQQLKIFGIAVPANEVSDSGDYVTSSNDLVINGLRLITSVLPANYNAAVTIHDFLGHNLIDTYLNNENTNTAIKHGISSALDGLAFNLQKSVSLDYFRILDIKSVYPQYDFLPITIMRDKELVYADNKLQTEHGYYYYFSNSKTYPVLLYPSVSGRYTINLSALNVFNAYQNLDATILKSSKVVGSIYLVNCTQNPRVPEQRSCQKSTKLNNFDGTLGTVQFNYNPNDLMTLKINYPDLFGYLNLITIEEFSVI